MDFYCHGICTLLVSFEAKSIGLSISIFHAAVGEYWFFKLRTINADTEAKANSSLESPVEHQPYNTRQLTWESSVALANAGPPVIALLISSVIGHRFHIMPRVLTSLFIIALSLAMNSVFTLVNTDEMQVPFMIITLSSFCVQSFMTGIQDGGMTSLTVLLPVTYTGLWLQGQALGGVLAAILFLFVIGFEPNAEVTATCAFGFATIFQIASIFLLICFSHTKFYKV